MIIFFNRLIKDKMNNYRKYFNKSSKKNKNRINIKKINEN